MASRKRKYTYYKKSTFHQRLLSLVRFVLLLFIVFTIVNAFFIATYSIGSISMEPSMSLGERVFVSPLMLGPTIPFTRKRFSALSAPPRGALVIAAPTNHTKTTLHTIFDPLVSFFTLQRVRLGTQRFAWESEAVVKRIVGIPGDTIKMESFVAYIKPENLSIFQSEFELAGDLGQQYKITFSPPPEGWQSSLPFSGTMKEMTLGDDEYFVLGDNRTASHDSQSWGPIPIQNIRAKVLLRYWPLRKIGIP
jgi:signal peptidase I